MKSEEKYLVVVLVVERVVHELDRCARRRIAQTVRLQQDTECHTIPHKTIEFKRPWHAAILQDYQHRSSPQTRITQDAQQPVPAFGQNPLTPTLTWEHGQFQKHTQVKLAQILDCTRSPGSACSPPPWMLRFWRRAWKSGKLSQGFDFNVVRNTGLSMCRSEARLPRWECQALSWHVWPESKYVYYVLLGQHPLNREFPVLVRVSACQCLFCIMTARALQAGPILAFPA